MRKPDFASFRYSFRVSRLHKSLFYRHSAVYPIHFRHARVLFRKSTTFDTHLGACLSVSHACLPFYMYRIDSRVSRLRNFLLTGILPCTGFTFDFPEHQSYIYKINFVSRVSVRALHAPHATTDTVFAPCDCIKSL
jgi:hypothetical protein